MRMHKKAAHALRWLLNDFFFLLALFIRFANELASGTTGSEKRVVLFGAPILSLRYIAKAVQAAGYESVTVVKEVYVINQKSDFDIVSPGRLQRYTSLLWGRTWIVYFDSFDQMFGLLRYSPGLVKRLAGVRLIAMPYGGDAYQYSLVTDTVLRHALMIDYPHNTSAEKRVSRNVRTISNCADIVIGCLGHVVNLYRWDALPVHYYPVDIEYIDSLKNGIEKHKIFTIVHTPNHRGVKGTELIIQAVQELKDEGVELDLRLLQGVKNEEVIKNLHSAHLLIEQVIGGGYALSAMEGMACGLPVISHLNQDVCELFRIYSHLNECPILGCARTVGSIKEKIRQSMNDYAELSKLSRIYAEKYHSVEASSAFWGAVLGGESRPQLMNFYMQNPVNAQKTC